MTTAPEQARVLLAQASQARQAGRLDQAEALARRAADADETSGPVWNLLGLVQLDRGDHAGAITSLRQAVAVDPTPPFAWFNLSRAQRLAGDAAGELESLGQALARDEYFLPAVLAKGEALCGLGRQAEAVELYRLLLGGLEPSQQFPAALEGKIDAARRFVDEHGQEQWQRYQTALAEVAAATPGADLSRAQVFAAQRSGRRRIYLNQPTAGHFPFLPAFEYFPRELFPWFQELERNTDAIRAELLALWAEDDPEFRPYVQFKAGEPLNQWRDLNHSPRWSAWFLWENGQRIEDHCRRCPRTAETLAALPMLDMPGKGPTAMFSVLQPHTVIPAHTGSTNARTTVHLPLVVPPECGFRVGGETRAWREGEAWAFDDTIEHEAWNNSDQPRAILIIDAWNPLLSEAEREVVRRVG